MKGIEFKLRYPKQATVQVQQDTFRLIVSAGNIKSSCEMGSCFLLEFKGVIRLYTAKHKNI